MSLPYPLWTAWRATLMWLGWSASMRLGELLLSGPDAVVASWQARTAFMTTLSAAVGGAIYGLLRPRLQGRLPVPWLWAGLLAGALVTVPLVLRYARRGQAPGEFSFLAFSLLVPAIGALLGVGMAAMAQAWARRPAPPPAA